MAKSKISSLEFSIEELDRELIIRGSQLPEKVLFGLRNKKVASERDVLMKRVRKNYYFEESLASNEVHSHISTEELVNRLLLKTNKMSMTEGR